MSPSARRVVRPHPPADIRFWNLVDITDHCWEWRARPAGTRYGSFTDSGRSWSAHRYSYTLAFGPIPDGMNVLHRCDNGWCVRPSHLFLGTHTDNMKDMAAKGRGRSGHMKHETCPLGHPMDGDNLYVTPKGMRQCRECVRRRGREYHARHRSSTCPARVTA